MKGEISEEEEEEEKQQQKEEFPKIIEDKKLISSENSISYINYINICIQNAKNPEEKESLLYKLAQNYEYLASKEEKEKSMKCFNFWQKALSIYNEILNKNKNNQIAFLGKIKSLLKMAKFKQVLTLLKNTTNEALIFTAEFWILGSIAYRKQNNYSKASEFILEAKKLEKKNHFIDREIALIQRIEQNNVQQKIKTSFENKVFVEEKYFNSRKNQTEFYKILSVDGGGIRGIIPAFWLMEIERRTRRPISHLFNKLAGTSTGAIISAGLSFPLNKFTPKYSASDLIDIYRKGK